MLGLTLVSLLWAFSFPLIKGTLTGLPSGQVALLRLLLSLLVFLPFVRPRAFDRGVALRLVGIGAVQFGLMYVLYIASYRFLPAHMIVLLTATTPLFVTLINDAMARRFHATFLLVAALAVGAGLIIQYPGQPLSAGITGVLLLQASNLAFAFGQVAYVRLSKHTHTWNDRQAFGFLYAGAALVAAVSVFSGGIPAVPTLSGRQIGVLLYLGIVASGLCFFLWNFSARKVAAGTLAVMNNLKIPLGVLASLLLLGEQTNYPRLSAGIVLMSLALFVNHRIGAPTAAKRPHPLADSESGT